MEKINLELNQDELIILTAILVSLSEDVQKGALDNMDIVRNGQNVYQAKSSFNSLLSKVKGLNMNLIMDLFDEATDAGFL